MNFVASTISVPGLGCGFRAGLVAFQIECLINPFPEALER